MNIWDYNQKTGRAQLVTADLVLIDEFKKLLEPSRNKCKEDPSGLEHLRADREFTYIYLAIDWKSPYSNFSQLEKALSPISVTVSGIQTISRLLQQEKVSSLITVMPSGILMDSSFSHKQNAFSPIVVTLLGRSSFVRPSKRPE